MIKVENLVTPSAYWWNVAIKGMRNAYKSTNKSDSKFKLTFEVNREDCLKCTNYYRGKCYGTIGDLCGLILGDNDKNLLLNLCKAGTSHRKVLRQLPVIMDITAPEYFWRQMDQYRIGTVTNSESTMHTLAKKEFELSDFSINYLDDNYCTVATSEDEFLEYYLIPTLNSLRERYFLFKHNIGGFKNSNRLIEEESKKCWYAINELLPQSYLQKRTWSANYEVLVNIIQQRRNHKLQEWNDFINYLLDNVPYLKEIIEVIND